MDGSEDAHNCVAFFPPAHSHVINSKELLTKQLKIHESEYKAEKGYKKIKKYKKSIQFIKKKKKCLLPSVTAHWTYWNLI